VYNTTKNPGPTPQRAEAWTYLPPFIQIYLPTLEDKAKVLRKQPLHHSDLPASYLASKVATRGTPHLN
jgi:hypothetical protein